MANFLTLLRDVFMMGMLPTAFTYAILQDVRTKEGSRRSRIAILVGFALTFIISLLAFLIPVFGDFLTSIMDAWFRSIWYTYVLYAIIALIVINIILDFRKDGK